MKFLFTGYILFLASCAASINSSSWLDVNDRAPGPSWPTFPLKPRVQYLANIAGYADPASQRTWLQKTVGNLFGQEEKVRTLLRPYGVFAREGRIFVSDPGTSTLHVFDRGEKIILHISKGGGEILQSPIGIAVDLGGEIYVSDSVLKKVFVFDQKGAYLRQIGSPDVFQRPTGIALLDNSLYVVDTLSHKILVFSKQDGKLRFSFGSHGNSKGEFNYPTNIFIDRSRTVYVMDSMNFRLQAFNEDGSFLFSFGKHGNGTGDFSKPKGIAVDSEGHIYVVDAHFDTIQIFDKNGNLLLVFGSSGTQKGAFSLPAGIFIDDNDRIYVADSYNKRVQIFQYLKEIEGDRSREK